MVLRPIIAIAGALATQALLLAASTLVSSLAVLVTYWARRAVQGEEDDVYRGGVSLLLIEGTYGV
jgi:hypothetical protein